VSLEFLERVRAIAQPTNEEIYERAFMKYLRTRVSALPIAAVMMLSGCSSTSSKVLVGPIVFTDANGVQQGGAHTSMTVGGTTYIDVVLADDTEMLGVDWTVACGSAPAAGHSFASRGSG